MSYIGEVGEGIQTRGEVTTFEWKITDFFSLSDKVDDRYHSPAFSCAGSSWCLHLYPNGQTERSSTGYLGLYLFKKDSGAPKTMRYVFGIKDSVGTVEKKKEFKRKFQSGAHSGWGLDKCWSRTKLKNRESTLMPNNVLTITCDLKNGDDLSTVKDSSTQTEDISEVPMEVKQSSEKLDACTETDCDLEAEVSTSSEKKDASSKRAQKVIHNMKTILAEGKRADFKLMLGDREWPVHKVILESRWKYFENMFRHDWIENTVGEVKFEDIQEEALDSVLEFVYTGDVEDISTKNICEIYVAAHKFHLEDLKSLCIELMKGNLCKEIVCKVLVIADRYEEEDLKESAVQYYMQEARNILGSEEWKQLKTNHVSIVADLLEETAKRELNKQTKE